MEEPKKLAIVDDVPKVVLELLVPIIDGLTKKPWDIFLFEKLRNQALDQSGSVEDRIERTIRVYLSNLLSQHKFVDTCQEYHLFNPLMLLAAFTVEKVRYQTTISKRIRNEIATNPNQIKILYALCDYCLESEKLHKIDVELMLNHKPQSVLVSAVLAEPKPKLAEKYYLKKSKENDEAIVKYWIYICNLAEQLKARHTITLDSFDLRLFYRSMQVKVDNNSIITACKKLDKKSLKYQCFQMLLKDDRRVNTRFNDEIAAGKKFQSLLINTCLLPKDLFNVIDNKSANCIQSLLTCNKDLIQFRQQLPTWQLKCKAYGLTADVISELSKLRIEPAVEVTTNSNNESPEDTLITNPEYLPKKKSPAPINYKILYLMHKHYCLITPLRQLDLTWQWVCLSYDDALIEAAINSKLITKKIVDKHGRTPLHFLALVGNLTWLKILIENGFDINVVDNYGSGLLHFAGLGNQVEMINYLKDQKLEVASLPHSHAQLDVALTKSQVSNRLSRSQVLDVIKYIDRELHAYSFRLCGINVSHSAYTQLENLRTDMMLVAMHCNQQAQKLYIDLRGVTLQASACLLDSDHCIEEHRIYEHCSAEVIQQYFNYRQQTLKDTQYYINQEAKTPAMVLFGQKKTDAQLAYLECLKQNVVNTATFQDKKHMTELMYMIISCEESVLLKYIEYRGESLCLSAELQNESGKTEAMLIASFATAAVATAYIQKRGKTFADTAAKTCNINRREEEYFFRELISESLHEYMTCRGDSINHTADIHFNSNESALEVIATDRCDENLTIHYLKLRGADIYQTREMTFSNGVPEGICLLRNDYNDFNNQIKLTYIKNRLDGFNLSKLIFSNDGFNELMTSFIHCDATIHRAMIECRGDTIKDSVLRHSENHPWYEGTIAYVFLSQTEFEYYLNQIPNENFRQRAKQTIVEQALSLDKNFFNTLYESARETVKTQLINKFALFQSIGDLRNQCHWPSPAVFNNALLIETRVNNFRVSNSERVFKYAIRSINEFIQHILAMQMSQVWHQYGYLVERITLMRELNPKAYDRKTTSVMLKLLEIIDWYDPKHNHTKPENNNYPWLSFYDFCLLNTDEAEQLQFIKSCEGNLYRSSIIEDYTNNTELLYVLNECSEQVQLNYIQSRAGTLNKTANCFVTCEAVEEDFIFNKWISNTGLVIKYIEARGDTLTSLKIAKLILQLSNIKPELVLSYINACKEGLHVGAGHQVDGNTHAMWIIRSRNEELIRYYFKFRGQTLADTNHLENECNFTEAMMVYCYCNDNDDLVKQYIASLKEHYTDNDSMNFDAQFWYEKAVAFVMLSPEMFDHYIQSIFAPSMQTEMRKKILKWAFDPRNRLCDKLVRANRKMKFNYFERDLLKILIIKLGNFSTIDLPTDIILPRMPFDTISLYVNINNKVMRSNQEGFSTCITNMKEFNSYVNKHNPSFIWNKLHHLLDYLPVIKEINQEKEYLAYVSIIDYVFEKIQSCKPGVNKPTKKIKSNMNGLMLLDTKPDKALLQCVSRFPHQSSKQYLKNLFSLLNKNKNFLINMMSAQQVKVDLPSNPLYCSAKYLNKLAFNLLHYRYMETNQGINPAEFELFYCIVSGEMKDQKTMIENLQKLPSLSKSLIGTDSALHLSLKFGDFLTLIKLLSAYKNISLQTDTSQQSIAKDLTDKAIQCFNERITALLNDSDDEIVFDNKILLLLKEISDDAKIHYKQCLKTIFIDGIDTDRQEILDYENLYVNLCQYSDDLRLAHKNQTDESWDKAYLSCKAMFQYLRDYASNIEIRQFMDFKTNSAFNSIYFMLLMKQPTANFKSFEKYCTQILDPDKKQSIVENMKSKGHLSSMLMMMYQSRLYREVQLSRLEAFDEVFDNKPQRKLSN